MRDHRGKVAPRFPDAGDELRKWIGSREGTLGRVGNRSGVFGNWRPTSSQTTILGLLYRKRFREERFGQFPGNEVAEFYEESKFAVFVSHHTFERAVPGFTQRFPDDFGWLPGGFSSVEVASEKTLFRALLVIFHG